MQTIWIDALEFGEYGGFQRETQFVQEMGQGYLLALGCPGVPVAPASTAFNVNAGGSYRIWVRVKNWLAGYAPGRLKLLVDGEYLPAELGTQPNGQWYWEIAGDAPLRAGSHTLQVEDTTGYFGRFAAVVITDDLDYTPEHRVDRLWRERAALRGEALAPKDMGAWDLVVAGAGPGGIPAAVAAARKGLRVALVHSRPGLGGNASDEATVGLDGANCRHPGMRETGIAEEIRRIKDHKQTTWEAAMRELVEAEPNLTVFYDLFVMDAAVEDGTIVSMTAIHTVKGGFHAFRGSLFVDATGDGWLGYYAGARYRLGREAYSQYRESFAPQTADNHTMSGCIMGTVNGSQALGFLLEDAGEPVPFAAPEWALRLPEGEALHRWPGRLHTGEWWLENPTDWDDLWQQEVVRDELFRLNLGYIHWLKNSYPRRALTRNLRLKCLTNYNARRENRRIIGDYVLTQNDCMEGARFPDGISYCGWSLDVHNPKGIYSGKEGPYYSDAHVQITHIPYRCLYSKNIANLFLAGRCVSVSHLALGSVRVESTLATLGQAVGVAAWLCRKKGCAPRELGSSHMGLLQQILIRDDLYLPDIPAADDLDLARRATVTASSVSAGEGFSFRTGVLTGWDALDTDLAACRDYDHEMDRAEVLVKNNGPARQMNAVLAELPASGAFEQMRRLERVQVTVPAGWEGYLALPLKPRLETEGFRAVGLVLEAAEGLSWRRLDFCSDHRKRAAPLGAHHWSTDNSHSYAVRFGPEQELPAADCGPQAAVNGWSRILGPDRYGWVSDPAQPLPQWLELGWEEPVTVSRLHLVFDTDLVNPKMSYLIQPDVPASVRDFRVEALENGAWRQVFAAKDQYLRRATVALEPVFTQGLRVLVDRTWGDASARIIEVRAYEGNPDDTI